jgi:hypothetical protein
MIGFYSSAFDGCSNDKINSLKRWLPRQFCQPSLHQTPFFQPFNHFNHYLSTAVFSTIIFQLLFINRQFVNH